MTDRLAAVLRAIITAHSENTGAEPSVSVLERAMDEGLQALLDHSGRLSDLAALKRFARQIIQCGFEGYDLTGADIQDAAQTWGLITMTTYDPVRHGHEGMMVAEPGDVWFEFADILKEGQGDAVETEEDRGQPDAGQDAAPDEEGTGTTGEGGTE